MSTKEAALACLESLPAEAEAWTLLLEEAQRFHAIAQAEADILAERIHSAPSVLQHFETKWKARP